MGLFGKKKKEEVKEVSCCCSGAAEQSAESCCCAETAEQDNEACCCQDSPEQNSGNCCCGSSASDNTISSIKVLGAGCSSCHIQYESAKTAVKNLGLDIEVEYVTDMEKIMGYGIMSMPGIVINEKVVSMGRVLKPADVEKLLRSY